MRPKLGNSNPISPQAPPRYEVTDLGRIRGSRDRSERLVDRRPDAACDLISGAGVVAPARQGMVDRTRYPFERVRERAVEIEEHHVMTHRRQPVERDRGISLTGCG